MQTQVRVMKPVKKANVMSITPRAVNEIIHEGMPRPTVKVDQRPQTMNKILKVGKKSLITRKIPHNIAPILKKLIKSNF